MDQTTYAGMTVQPYSIEDSTKYGKRGLLPARYMMAIIASAGCAVMYGLKMNLSTAIISMVNHTAVKLNSPNRAISNLTVICEYRSTNQENGTEVESRIDGPFIWDESIQGLILSAYYWGFIVGQFPAGRIAELFSAKWLIIGGNMVNIIGCLLTPWAARLHYGYFIALRVIQGLGGGVQLPSAQVLIAKWSPPNDRSVLGSIIYSGVMLGFIIAMALSAILADRVSWDNIFYIEGAIPVIWCAIAVTLLYDSPEEQKIFITREEKDYIARSLGKYGDENTNKKIPIPWKHVIRSAPFRSIVVSHFCSGFAWVVLSTTLPSFLYHILLFDQTQTAGLLVIANSGKWVAAIVLGKMFGILQTKRILTITSTRKIATLIATIIPMICMISISYVGCNHYAVLSLIALAITCEAAIFSGFHVNHVDIAPNFAGTLMGITITFSALAGFIVPVFVGSLTQGGQTMETWRKIFLITAVVYAIDGLNFTIFGSGEVQPWNDLKKSNKNESQERHIPEEEEGIPLTNIDNTI